MELHELKNIWTQGDQRVDQQFTINFESLKKISVKKAKSLFWTLKFTAVFEAVVNVVFLPPTIGFIVNYSSQPKFALPALLLALMLIFTIACNVYSLVLLATINYRLPIVRIQKKLQSFTYWNTFRQQRLLYFLYPLAQTSLLIIIFEAVPGIDLYNYPVFLLLQFVIALLIVPGVIWIMKLSNDKNMDAAISFLNDIKKFEKE